MPRTRHSHTCARRSRLAPLLPGTISLALLGRQYWRNAPRYPDGYPTIPYCRAGHGAGIPPGGEVTDHDQGHVDDRPIDGVDQTDLLLGRSDTARRDALLTFVGPDLLAVRWKQFRMRASDGRDRSRNLPSCRRRWLFPTPPGIAGCRTSGVASGVPRAPAGGTVAKPTHSRQKKASTPRRGQFQGFTR
jgi:hypothetical protein